jgi:hypothetical protein
MYYELLLDEIDTALAKIKHFFGEETGASCSEKGMAIGLG